MLKIDGVILKQMLISGSNNLYNSYPEIDALNVFPVPDGDTGTNMNLTMSSGAKEVFSKNTNSVSQVAKDFARGLLMGARGNSGVILSQIFRGFAEGLENKDEVDAIELANAFVNGKIVAYKAVMRPVEGTILTVIREASTALYEKVEKDMPIDECLDILLEEAKKSLERTPDLLPVLKEVGVVDSGGAGLCKILEGFAKALHNEIVEKVMASVTETGGPYTSSKPTTHVEHGNVQAKFKHEEFGYCTQFLMQLPDPKKMPSDKKVYNEKKFKAVLEAYGNSIVCVSDQDLVKVHIHTLKPGNILTYAQQFGEFKMIKIDNMSEQHEELLLEDEQLKQAAGETEISESEKIEVKTAAPKLDKPQSEYALVTVAVGQGIEDLFTSLYSEVYLISGGQTMNPSTADFVDTIKKTNAKNIFVFPNNSNIVMAANQASDLLKDDYNIRVIPTKTIPEGLVACMVFNAGASVDENVSNMLENIAAVKSGEITYAIKDTTIDGVTVEKDHFMGITGKKIVCCHKHKINTLTDMLTHMVDDDSSIIQILCGEDVTEEEKEKVTEYVTDKYGDMCDISIEEGKQPVYSFFVAVE